MPQIDNSLKCVCFSGSCVFCLRDRANQEAQFLIGRTSMEKRFTNGRLLLDLNCS